MSVRLFRPVTAALVVLSMLGCQPRTDSPGELRLVTPDQMEKLLLWAERVETGNVERQQLKNSRGVVVGTVTSSTSVIYLPRSAGGGKFSVSTTCTTTCIGIPIHLDPGKPTNSCACNDKCDTCTGPVDSAGCAGSCTSVKTGFGNFGIFIQ